jgi:hypothetical protein
MRGKLMTLVLTLLCACALASQACRLGDVFGDVLVDLHGRERQLDHGLRSGSSDGDRTRDR